MTGLIERIADMQDANHGMNAVDKLQLRVSSGVDLGIDDDDAEFLVDLIRDLIAALQAAPTAEQLRGWADTLWDAGCATACNEMEAAADRMEGK